MGRRVTEPQPALPPGPYRVEWPAEQGGAFTLWGRQGTPPDFRDGWAIPLVASGVDTVIYALADILNTRASTEPSTLTVELLTEALFQIHHVLPWRWWDGADVTGTSAEFAREIARQYARLASTEPSPV